jgi:hypothetical protein
MKNGAGIDGAIIAIIYFFEFAVFVMDDFGSHGNEFEIKLII